ncbi:MAG TPA: hypothetical protein ENL34_07310 [Chloroflexi bacterium]|nr:hypothetical protein [Chloroflexota bacterium]
MNPIQDDSHEREESIIWGPPLPPMDHPEEFTWPPTDVDPIEWTIHNLTRSDLRARDLKELILALGETPKGRRRADLARQWATHLLDPERLRHAVSRLSSEARDTLARLIMKARFNEIGWRVTASAFWQDRDISEDVSAVELYNEGLVFASTGNTLYIPPYLHRFLPSVARIFPTVSPPDRVAPMADPRDLVAQIQHLIGLLAHDTFTLRPWPWDREMPNPTPGLPGGWPLEPSDQEGDADPRQDRDVALRPPDSHLSDETLSRWTTALDASPERIEWLFHLLLAAGIAKLGDTIILDRPKAEHFLTLSPGQQIAQLYWLNMGMTTWAHWWRLWRLGEVRVCQETVMRPLRFAYPLLLQGYFQRLRQIILEALAILPEDQWLSFDDVAAWVVQIVEPMQRLRYLRSVRGWARGEEWLGFPKVVLRCLLSGALHPLGLVDLAPSLEDPQRLRLRGLQDLHWQRLSEAAIKAIEPPAVTDIRYEAERHHLLLSRLPVPPRLLAFLLKWASLTGTEGEALVFEPTVHRLHRAFQAGETPASLAATWMTLLGFAPPDAVRQWWEKWSSRYGRVRIYPGHALLQTRDAETMEELQLALPSLAHVIVAEITPAHVLLKREAVDELLTDLQRQGHTPKEIT